MLPLIDYIDHPRIFFSSLLKETGFLFPDKLYLQMMYYLKTGKRLDLTNPITFGEKLQWLKLYDRRPEYVAMVDKYDVKDYVGKIIGKKYVVPTLGLWDRPECIDFDVLPNQFVLKTTHGGGSIGVVICKDKPMLDKQRTILSLKKAMEQNLYKTGREWPYKNVRSRILAEQFLSDGREELMDYKVHVFGGTPRIIQVDYNRFISHKRTLYDTSWKKIEGTIGFPTDENREIERPAVLNELLVLSSKLAKGIPYVRTDFYIVGNQIYFGEMTFYHGSGYERILPESLDVQMGNWIEIPDKSPSL